MPVFIASARSANTAATVNHAAMQLWNPHASITLVVSGIWRSKVDNIADIAALRRSNVRGTPASSVVVLASNNIEANAAPVSGAVLDIGPFSVQPTLIAGPSIFQDSLPAAIGEHREWVPATRLPLGVIWVPPGRGLVIVTPVATILRANDFTFFWEETA